MDDDGGEIVTLREAFLEEYRDLDTVSRIGVILSIIAVTAFWVLVVVYVIGRLT